MATSHLFILVLLFLSSSFLVFSERCHPDDKKALLQIKKDLKHPYVIISWDPKDDCCEWLVLECDEKTNRITDLDLSQINVTDLPIPGAVGDLPYLQSLSFHKANVAGQIPRAITKLSQLKTLDLTWNHLTGPVPSFLAHLRKLTRISLSFNSLTGSIPASLSQLPELDSLFLDRNKLTGSIPETFGEFKQQDFYLVLSHNNLSGPIPRKLGHANFGKIDVSRNKLEGDISFLFGKNKKLGVADFSRNLFHFDISKVKFPKTLTNLDLNHNKIFGSLPKGLARIHIISLNVSYNRLCGPIPQGGNAMLEKKEYYAFFHNKCLCGAPLPVGCK